MIHRLDKNTTLILTDDMDQAFKIAEDLTSDNDILLDIKSFTIENEEEDILIVSFKDNSGEIIKIAITQVDRLREVLKRKHPEMDDEEIAMRLDLYKDQFDVDFARPDVEVSDDDEEGLISEEEAETMETEIRMEEEEVEEEGLMSFADEIKYIFEGQGGMGVSLVYIPSGKQFDVKKVRDDGLAVHDVKLNKLVLLKDEVLNEKADQFEIV